MENILSRIQEIASSEGITIGALERSIGASKGVLSRAINNGTDIQSKWIRNLVEKYPHYSTRWLLTGSGERLLSNGSNTISGDISNSAVSTAGPPINTVGQHSAELQTENHHLQQRITDLERLLDEKERLISILLSKQ